VHKEFQMATNFPNGLMSMGVPVGGAGMFGAQGTSYFVDTVAGNNGYNGKTAKRAKKTVQAAYDLCVGGQNDVVYLLSNGASTSGSGTADVLTEAIVWSKHRTHLIGVCAPQKMGQRARINTTTAMTPMFTLSGRGCYIANIQFSNNHSHATAGAVCMLVSGDNSSFENCHFQGLGALGVVDNSHRALKIDSADDCFFKDCTIGATTVDGVSAANYVIEFVASGAASNNTFEDCVILGNGSSSSFFVYAGATGTAGMTLFKNCVFWNCNNGVQDTMTYAMDMTAGGNGTIILHNSSITGAADMANNPGNIFAFAPVVGSGTDLSFTVAVVKT
jgi:hypothetical protein